MTSEEALGILYSKADTTEECWECRQIVEKDLEMLEILKSHAKLIELNSVYIGYPKTIVIAIDADDADYEKIKELIENDK